jgi:hypothetical protein
MIPINNMVAGQDDSHTGGDDPDEEIRDIEQTGPDKDKIRQWRFGVDE